MISSIQSGSETFSKKNPSRQSRSNSSNTPPKIQYRGITLKEYFRLCDAGVGRMEKIQQEVSQGSEASSRKQTPVFGGLEEVVIPQGRKRKMKTEVQQMEQSETITREVGSLNSVVASTFMGHKNSSSPDKKNPSIQHPNPFSKKNPKQNSNIPYDRKRIVSIPSSNPSSKLPNELVNRSTLTSFYHLEKKKKKMLTKLKTQKERNNQNESQLNDVFFITKYAGRFGVDPKAIS